MEQHTTNGHGGRIERPVVRDTGLRQDVKRMGTLFNILALGCELVLDLNEPPFGEGEG